MRVSRPRLGSGGGRRRVGAGLALLAAIAVVVVIVLTTKGSPSSPAAATNASDTSGGVTVERRNLVETDTEAGTLSYSDPQTVYNRLSGTITWLPSAGQEIRPGGTLYKVDGEPVIMLNGSTPAFRKMHSGMSAGADVLQLNRNLVRLGFNPGGIVINDTWQPATTVGVEQFQDSLGESPTGSLPLGQVVFLPGDQLVTTVEGTLGAAGGGSTSPPTSATSTPVARSHPEFVDLTTVGAAHPELVKLDNAVGAAAATSSTTASTPTTPTTPTTSTTSTTTTPSGGTGGQTKKKKAKNSVSRQTLAALIALLRAEIAQLKSGHSPQGSPGSGSNPKSSSPRKSSSPSKKSPNGSSGSGGGGGGGGGGGSATAILETTSTHLVVTVDLGASVQSEAVVGEPVTVQMPAGNTVDGKITAVSSIAQSSSSGSGNGNNSGGSGGGGGGNGGGSGGSPSTIPVTVTLKGHHSGAGLDQAAVSVNFAQQRANHVLSVPVTALLATSGGNYAVQESAPPHKLIPVTTGLFAAGYVQISGSGVYPGLHVTDSQG